MNAIRFAYYTPGEKLLHPFYSIPTFLWEDAFRGLSNDAKLLYGLLLSRTELSRKNGWIADGRIFIIFTTKEVIEKLNCCEQKAVGLMKSLEKHRLIERQRNQNNQAYRIFLKQPVEITVQPVKNDGRSNENHCPQAMKTTRYIDREHIYKHSQIDVDKKNSYGCNRNVFLTDEEYRALKTEFPQDYEKRIDRLSNYMRATGKSYSNHLATIRLWAGNETEKERANRPDYSHSKGVSL